MYVKSITESNETEHLPPERLNRAYMNIFIYIVMEISNFYYKKNRNTLYLFNILSKYIQ